MTVRRPRAPALLVAAALLVGCGDGPPTTRPALSGPDAVSVSTASTAGSPVVEAFLVGKGPYRFVVDTGASVSFIHAELARSLGLLFTRDVEFARDAGHRFFAAWRTVAGTVRVGDLIARDVSFYAADDLTTATTPCSCSSATAGRRSTGCPWSPCSSEARRGRAATTRGAGPPRRSR